MKTISNFLKDAGTFYLATNEGNQPHVRPMGFQAILNDKLYILTASNMTLYSQLIKNNQVEVSAMVEKNWLRLKGKLIADNNQEIQNAIYSAAPQLKQMFPPEVIAPFYFSDVTATINSFTEPSKTYQF